MFDRILVVGATGLLGRPVVNSLTKAGHTVRILARSAEKADSMFGDAVEITEGSATNIDDVRPTMTGYDAVHINLSPAIEYTDTSHVIEVANGRLEGEPALANDLYGAPVITLDDWFKMPRDERGGFAH